jgi:hypothetical protein
MTDASCDDEPADGYSLTARQQPPQQDAPAPEGGEATEGDGALFVVEWFQPDAPGGEA